MSRDPIIRRHALPLIAAVLSSPLHSRAVVAAGYNPGENPAELSAALGGLKPGTGRPLNALIKLRAETGVERVDTSSSPLFKPGAVLDTVRTADGGTAEARSGSESCCFSHRSWFGFALQVAFAFPAAWTLAGGPNLDVRDVRQSDSAFLLVGALPAGQAFESLPDNFFLDLLFDPAGKYGQYGQVEDRKVLSCTLTALTLPNGRKQQYRRMALKFAPLSYNANTVERRALLSATAVGGSVFVMVSGSLATRYKAVKEDLLEVQESFRAIVASSSGRSATSAS